MHISVRWLEMVEAFALFAPFDIIANIFLFVVIEMPTSIDSPVASDRLDFSQWNVIHKIAEVSFDVKLVIILSVCCTSLAIFFIVQ